MIRILVSRHQRLVDGDVYRDFEEIFIVPDNKSICVSLSKKFLDHSSGEPVVYAYIQIGNFLEKDFIEIELFHGDYFYVHKD